MSPFLIPARDIDSEGQNNMQNEIQNKKAKKKIEKYIDNEFSIEVSSNPNLSSDEKKKLLRKCINFLLSIGDKK